MSDSLVLEQACASLLSICGGAFNPVDAVSLGLCTRPAVLALVLPNLAQIHPYCVWCLRKDGAVSTHAAMHVSLERLISGSDTYAAASRAELERTGTFRCYANWRTWPTLYECLRSMDAWERLRIEALSLGDASVRDEHLRGVDPNHPGELFWTVAAARGDGNTPMLAKSHGGLLFVVREEAEMWAGTGASGEKAFPWVAFPLRKEGAD